jgi:hypothetical protein
MSRSRTIYLLYIIFLLLIFAFVPFRPSPETTDVNYKMEQTAKELELVQNTNTLLLLHLMQDNPELFEEVKFKCLEIERDASYPLEYIKLLRFEVQNPEDSSRRFSGIQRNQIDTLFKKIRAYRLGLLELLEPGTISMLNDILPDTDYEKNSKGKLIPSQDFYFPAKASSEFVLNNLAVLEMAIIRAKVLGFNQIVNSPDFRSLSGSLFDQIKLSGNEELSDLLQGRSLRDFFNHIENLRLGHISQQIDRGTFIIEKLQGNQISSGQLIKYKLRFEIGAAPLIVKVNSVTESETFQLSEAGLFVYYPHNTGLYSFTFTQGESLHEEQIAVVRKQDILNSYQLPVLFKGIENEINIRPLIAEMRVPIDVQISKGSIRNSGDQYFALVESSGGVQIDVYANMPYGRVLVDQKKYLVSNNPPISIQFTTYPAGSYIPSNEIKEVYFMQLISDLDIGAAEIVDFQILKISRNTNLVTPTITNYGPNFNPATRSLLANCSSGDLIMVTNARVRSPKGQILNLLPYSVYVK